jgi:hypothetical protein
LKFLIRQIDEYIQVTEFMIQKTAALDHGAGAVPKCVWTRAMHFQTKFLRLCRPVSLGDRIDDWRVCWLGGWDCQGRTPKTGC